MNLWKSLAAVSSMTMFSPCTQLYPAMPLSLGFHGASVAADAFFVAFKLPDLLRRIYAEGHSPGPLCRFYRNIKPAGREATAPLSPISRDADTGSGGDHRARNAGRAVDYLCHRARVLLMTG